MCNDYPQSSFRMVHRQCLANISSRIKYWKPRFNNAGPQEHRRTPVYILLANEAKQRSIELAPLPYLKLPITPSTSNHNAPHHPSLSSSGSPGGIDATSAESSQSSLHDLWPDDEFKSPKVLYIRYIKVLGFSTRSLQISACISHIDSWPVGQIYERLEKTCCGSILCLLSNSTACEKHGTYKLVL